MIRLSAMNGRTAAVVALFLGINLVRSLNIARLRQACRVEDGFSRCSPNAECHRRAVDGSECETNHLPCTNDEVRCNSSMKCVPRYSIGTGSGCENRDMRLPCRKDEFTCSLSGLCIPRTFVRNGLNDCSTPEIEDFSDESSPLDSCYRQEFRCQDKTRRCIPREWVIDGHEDCFGNSDELRSLGKCMENEFQCGDGRCILRYRVVDGFADCKDRSDENDHIRECYTTLEFRCKDTGRCIPRSWVLDGISNCNDSSDETVFENYTCLDSEFSCLNGRRCLPSKFLCDGISHCEDCSDEVEACDEPVMDRCGENITCGGNTDCPALDGFGFKCPSGLVIPQWSLGDAHSLCQDDSDICFKNGSYTCAKCVASGKIIAKEQICDGVLDCADLTDECLCEACGKSSSTQKLCDSVCYSDTPSEPCNVCSIGQLRCPGETKCIKSIDVCNGVVDCSLSQIDESNCGRTASGSCSFGNSNRCSAEMFTKDLVSSQDEMIRNPIFIVLIWIQAVVAIFGNAVVLFKRAKGWKGYKEAKRSGAITRMNMAIANFCLGVMLVVIGSTSSAMSGNYCRNEIDWRNSTTCKAIGALTTWFSEVSVFTLVVQSCYRLYGYYVPFKATNQRLRTSIAWAISVWMLSLIISCVPFFYRPRENVWTEVLISPSLYFQGPIVSWQDYKRFTTRIATLAPQYTSGNTSSAAWSEVEDLTALNIVGYFGYYQSQGVCLPQWFSTDEALPLPAFTVFLFSTNMACVVFASIANLFLLFKLKNKKAGQTKRKFLQDSTNRRQVMVTTLSLAYFLCWLGLLIISSSGSHVSAEVYSVGTLVFFPLPCVLSPLIYTMGFKDIRKAVVSKFRKLSKNEIVSDSKMAEQSL